MFHYINWRPTDVIKKHSPPSETDFFLSKEGNITPPQPKTKKPYQVSEQKGPPNKSVRTKGVRTKGAEQKGPFINN